MKLQRTEESLSIAVYGHLLQLPCVQLGRRHALFFFDQLCNSDYGAVDYLELARRFSVVAIRNIPQLNIERRNELRRFITLVDALYEHKVLVLFQADAPAQSIFSIGGSDHQHNASTAYDEVG